MSSGASRPLTPRAWQIVQTARRILEQDGRDGLSMRRIAAELEIRAPSIYEHLRGKQELEAALISVGLDEQATLFTQAVQHSDDPIAALAAAYRDFARRQPNLYRLMNERPLPRDLLTAGVEEAAAMPLLAAAGGDRDRARAIWAFAHGMVLLEMNRRFPDSADLDAAWRQGLSAFGGNRGGSRDDTGRVR